MNVTKLSRALVGTAVAGLVLAGCGAATETAPTGAGAPGSSGVGQSAHNDADIAFTQGMTVHHQQAVEMAELAAGRSENPQLLDLAARIGAAQGPEIDTMNAWLAEWGAETPTGGMDGMGGMGGMMTPEQMTQLEQTSGAEFDRLFLEMMTEHHMGAVEMAQAELADGSDPRATELAQMIIDTQQAEISEMEGLLTQL